MGFPKKFNDPSYFKGFDRVIKIINKYNIKISIYVIGKDLENKEIFARVRDWSSAGHEIGNHSWSHYHNLGSLEINEISVKDYERVVHVTNKTTNLDCIISIHNTKLGPALGGVRSWEYNNFEEQKSDTLKLSEAMTLKNSVCGINFGGGKATLNLKGIRKTPE